MKKISVLILILFGFFQLHGAQAQFISTEALSQVETFISHLDNRHYEQAYRQTSRLLRIQANEEEWIKEQDIAFQLLGDVLDRQMTTLKSREAYPGMPDGHYLIVAYETRTLHKSKAVEVILLMEEEQSWKVCKYSIR